MFCPTCGATDIDSDDLGYFCIKCGWEDNEIPPEPRDEDEVEDEEKA